MIGNFFVYLFVCVKPLRHKLIEYNLINHFTSGKKYGETVFLSLTHLGGNGEMFKIIYMLLLQFCIVRNNEIFNRK